MGAVLKFRALPLFAAIALAGCANTDGLAPRDQRSGFDGARVVDIAPHGTACNAMPCISIGAQWSSKQPQFSFLTVKVSGDKFTSISRIELAVDGVESRYQAPPKPTALSSTIPTLRDSTQDFVVPTEVLRKVASAKRAWVRVHTSDGYLDAAVVDGQEDSKALHALRRLLAQVDAG